MESVGGSKQTGGVFDLKPRCAEWSVYDIKVPRAIQKHKGAFTPDANEALIAQVEKSELWRIFTPR